MKLNKVQTFKLVLDSLITTGLVNKIHYTENYNQEKPSERVLVPFVPELRRETYGGGYMRGDIPLNFVISEKVVTKEHYSQGHNHGTFTITERSFFEGSVNVFMNPDSGRGPGFGVRYSVSSDVSNTGLENHEGHIRNHQRLIDIFRQIEVLLSTITVVEDESDFSWVKKKVEVEKNRVTDVDDLSEFGELTMESINNYYPEDEDVKGLCKFLKGKGGTKKQLEEFSDLLSSLGDNKSELAGSPDRGVTSRFEENCDEFETLLKSILGQDDFNEVDLYF